MVKSIVCYTKEIDDYEAAAAEILAQIEAGGGLLAHSVALVSCYSDFVTTGTYKYIANAMPCECIGTTVLASAAPGSDEYMLFSMMVLTSDDAEFYTGLTDSLAQGAAGKIGAAYSAAVPGGTKPAVIVSAQPLLVQNSGDYFVGELTRAGGDAPVFGAVAVDNSADYHDSFVLYGGEHYTDRLAFVCIAGDVSADFYLATLSSEKVFLDKGVVTDVDGNHLKTINDMPVGDYLTSIGLFRDESGNLIGINSYPFVVDYMDGSEPVIRCMYLVTPEGYAVCGGDIPAGATISVSNIDADEVVRSSAETAGQITSDGACSAALIFSCVGRYFTQGFDTTREADAVRGVLDAAGVPYTFSYVGGETCPVKSDDAAGGKANRFHNDTLIACILR
jgi:hypothetical protein